MNRRGFVAAGISGGGAGAMLENNPPRLAAAGLERYMAFQRLGPGDGREEYVDEVMSSIRPLIDKLIGAQSSANERF